MSSPCYIDFEAFQHGEESYKIKELCVLSSTNLLFPIHMIFRPHKKWDRLSMEQKQTYAYQTNHHHHILWNEGWMRYCRRCVFAIIEYCIPDCRRQTFYVMGGQKLRFLQNEFPQLHFVEMDVTFNHLPQLPHSMCHYRNHGDRCAFLKCYKLYYHNMLLY